MLTVRDVAEGDDVKNGRSSAWGRVVAVEASDTGAVHRLRVRRHKGLGVLQWEPRWWPAESIIMVARRSGRGR